MVLQSVSVHSTAVSAAGTETSFGSTAFAPSGFNEVQEMPQAGAGPSLIGYHGQIVDVIAASATAANVNYYYISLNTDTQAQYIKIPWDAAEMENPDTGGTAQPFMVHPQGIHWIPDIPLPRDADWDVRCMGTNANVPATIMLYMTYGTKYPYQGGRVITRQMTATADSTVNVWSTVGTITDLDPRITYRVHGLAAAPENATLCGIRITSTSNSTYVGALQSQVGAITTGYGTQAQPTFFPHDSILINGVETATVEALVDGAQKPSAWVWLEEYTGSGVSGGGTPAPGGNILSGLVGGAGGGLTGGLPQGQAGQAFSSVLGGLFG